MNSRDWIRSGDYDDVRYETAAGVAKITICRPEVRNAFRPQTLFELSRAFDAARDDAEVGVGRHLDDLGVDLEDRLAALREIGRAHV